MTLGREHVGPLRAAMAALIGALAFAPSAQALTPLPPPPVTQADAYKLHMENGVKLFEDRNYDAARAEFRAAYDARPKANPLLNIALAYKAEFKYPRAIEALETALAKHRDTMGADDVKAAEGELKDMRALLARVKIVVSPAAARVTIDGDALTAEALQQPIPLGPGTHRVTAAAEEFASIERSFTVASSETTEVTLTLSPEQGTVQVEAPDPGMTIAVDQRVVGTGAWTGLLPLGSHRVQITGAGRQPFVADILVVAGKPIVLRPDATHFSTLPPAPPVRKEPLVSPSRHGFYALAMGSLLFQTHYPTDYPRPEVNSGGAGGARLGYQVNSVAGFDAFFQHSSLFTPSRYNEGRGYTLISNRIGADLRLMTPGKYVRGVGVIGGGLVIDSLRYDVPINGCPTVCVNSSGADPFVLLEAGLEFEFNGVLLGLALESQFQSSRGISTTTVSSPFGNDPLIHVGPGLRVGFAFW
jgi:hypothetical protein